MTFWRLHATHLEPRTRDLRNIIGRLFFQRIRVSSPSGLPTIEAQTGPAFRWWAGTKPHETIPYLRLGCLVPRCGGGRIDAGANEALIVTKVDVATLNDLTAEDDATAGELVRRAG